ncbi:MAG TPA: hypothetical protein VGL56_14055 [Fimbriimonadaceae bacterium]|jgi:hypothetical protein
MQSLLFSLVVSLTLSSPQQSVTLRRDLKEGDKASYKMDMVEHLESADANVTSAWTEIVKKDQGQLQLVVDNTDYAIEAGGMQVPAPPPGEMTLSIAPGGLVGEFVANQTSISKVLPDLFMLTVPEGKLQVGQSDTFTYKSSLQTSNGTIGSDMKGTRTLISVDNGVAKISIELSDKTIDGDKALKLKTTAYVRVSDSKLDHMDGTFSDLPTKLAGRYNVGSADFKVKRG